MGFKAAKQQVIKCLLEGLVLHEQRNNIDIKNQLAIGSVSPEEVANILKKASGNDYSTSTHHFDSNIDVHIVKTVFASQHWYIKWYFVEPDCVFISIHH